MEELRSNEKRPSAINLSDNSGLDAKRPTTPQTDSPANEPEQSLLLHGLRLWLLLAVMYLSIYLLALELTMLSTVIPTLTDEFGTVADISWYESAYVLPL